ncbi:phage tail tape measure protein [Billgrantia ethanolica]|uniref:Phage tail tape measure protein n=1 Tax=Billgrantia ethanolica TaxID=2733486 RepID=A0ABS9A633_9GAMM|nr:phage tail tape measure protein [Halomonas ethanolica]MCE8004220.1 phage tail tape measure protein [Halomonas ethanolica]
MANMVTSIVMELVDRVSGTARRIRQSLSGLAQRAGLDRLAGAATRVRMATGAAVGQLRNLTQRMAMIGGVAAGAVWGLRRLVGGFTEPADAAIKLSRRLSMTHEQMQLLMGAAGRMSDMGDSQMASNLESFSNRLAEAAAGMGEPAKAMQWAGIALRDSEGNMRGSMDVLLDIADKMATIDSEEMQTRFARAMFGRGGTGMINVLAEGREGLQREMDAWRRTGQLISEEDAQAAELYNDNLGELDGTIMGLRNTVVAHLVPALSQWLERVNELIQSNREVISERIIEGLRSFWEGLRTIGRVVSRVADGVGGFGNLLAWLAGLMAAKFIFSLGAAVLALGQFSWVLMTTPVGWFLGAIVAIAGAAYLIYRNWDGIVEWFGNLWEGIKAWFTQGIGGITRDLLAWSPAGLLLRGVDEMFELLHGVSLSEIGAAWIASLRAGIAAQWDSLTRWLSDKLDSLTSWLPDWAREGLGIQAAPQAEGATGAPIAGDRVAGMPAHVRADVGGELRIRVDSEGRARLTEARRNGGMDFSVESGMLGVMP